MTQGKILSAGVDIRKFIFKCDLHWPADDKPWTGTQPDGVQTTTEKLVGLVSVYVNPADASAK